MRSLASSETRFGELGEMSGALLGRVQQDGGCLPRVRNARDYDYYGRKTWRHDAQQPQTEKLIHHSPTARRGPADQPTTALSVQVLALKR
jgi:hypothetical protein